MIRPGAPRRVRFRWALLAGLAAVAAGLTFMRGGADVARGAPAAAVDAARLDAADSDATNWLAHGRTYDERRFSPLARINVENVARLAEAWHYDLPPDRHAQESTPLVVDGVMYVSSAWSRVHALDAATGARLWTYDPAVPGKTLIDACCAPVNRGLAVWKGKVYVGALDGRLIAIDARTGKPVWETMTVPAGKRYTITGAPRVVAGNVIIGNGGGEMGVRGFVSAYDAESGKLVWRFYTVPGDPSQPFESPALEKAAKTWTGEWWKLGGGGTVWDSLAYDPKLNLLYVGVGNGSPWNHAIRSPGGGDNLFLSSIVALRADSGEYVWHYQTTPGDTWDFTATQHMVLADLAIEGRTRKVLMQAPKNGFFYVLDRESGELLSAEAFSKVNWAQRIDLESGRPLENPNARYGETGRPWANQPAPWGAHNWQPMSFSPMTGLVYLPVNDGSLVFMPGQDRLRSKLAWNVGVDTSAWAELPENLVNPQDMIEPAGRLVAWDPVRRREAWRVPHASAWNGGVLSTAGNLVFQGNGAGEFAAFAADTGVRAWSVPVAGVAAPPIAYEIDGEQYIAVSVGWGGEGRSMNPRVLAFKLGGDASLKEQRATRLDPPPAAARLLSAPPDIASRSVIADGQAAYRMYCWTCHGWEAEGGVGPDLRHSGALHDAQLWQGIVHDGLLEPRGMVAFGAELGPAQVESIRAYVIRLAHETKGR